MRILFVGPSRIGDAVLASGLLNHLVSSYPDARFTVACGVAAAPLFEAVPGLEQLIPIKKLARSGHWWRLWRQVVQRRWSMIVDVRRSVIPWTVWAGQRAIAPASSRRDEHAVVTFARTLNLADDPPAPHLWIDDEHARRASDLVPDGSPVLAIGPTANWPGKIWQPEGFIETIARLTSETAPAQEAILPGARIAVFGGPAERDRAQPLLDTTPPDRLIDLVGGEDLLTVAACLKRCAFYIGNDSGLMHMAAAAGVPTLGLFGPSRPERYGPWGRDTAWVRTEKSYAELISVPDLYDPNIASLMQSLPVDDVVNAAVALWRESGRGSQ